MTEEKTNKVLEITQQIVPPLCLLSLAWVPVDLSFLAFLWFIAYIAFLVSCYRLVKFVFLRARKKEGEGEKKAVISIRALLTIITVTFAHLILNFSQNSADGYARQTAKEVANACKHAEACPPSINDWEQGRPPAASEVLYGVTALYRLRYIPSEDGKEFHLYVIHSIDEALSFRGGVGKELEEKLEIR